MAVRYDPQLLDEIRRTVKNYQAKRQRVLAKGGQVIPDPASVNTFLNDYTNRRKLIKDLKRLQRYSKRGAEELIAYDTGLTTTRYELEEVKRMVSSSKRNITRQLKQKPEDRLLQPLEAAHYEHLEAEYKYLSRPISKLTTRQFIIFTRIASGESDLDKRRTTFYENIYKMAEDITYGLPRDIANDFKEALDRIPMSQLTDLMATDTYLRAVMDYYVVMKAGGQVDDLSDKIADITEYLNAL